MKKVCLVGCGNIGRMHARNLAGRAVLCFHSRSPGSAERFLREFGGERVLERFDQAVEDPQIDALVISSPPGFHQQQVIRALEGGKSVLVEKPMCVTAGEIAEIQEAVEAHPEGFLMVAENYYYKPSLALIESLIREGAIGALESVFAQKRFAQEATGWKSGYGALLEGGVHFVALISAIFEAGNLLQPRQVAAEFAGHRPGEAERRSATRLEYENGATAELRYAWNVKSLTRGTFQHSRIKGSRGCITFESNGMYAWVNARRKKRFYFPGFRDLMGYRRMTQDFIDCLQEEGRKPRSDFHRAKRDLRIIFEAYRDL